MIPAMDVSLCNDEAWVTFFKFLTRVLSAERLQFL